LWLVVFAISVGGLTSLTAAFFGTVMPSSVGGKWEPPDATGGASKPKAEAAN
jgi:hypothetical protein